VTHWAPRYFESANQGYSPAIFSLGSWFLNNDASSCLRHDYLELFRRFAALHNPAAQYILGLCYYQGHGIAHDFSSAMHWLQLAATQGYIRSVVALGEIERQTTVIDRSDVLRCSLRHFNRATDEELHEYAVAVFYTLQRIF
jgi:TPR repeat protein